MFASFLVVAALVVDSAAHSVKLTAESTDCGLDAPVEFLLVGPESDHAYEAAFTTVDSPKAIADAFAKAGIPLGKAVSAADCRFWPTGAHLEVKPALGEYLRQMRDARPLKAVWTGGARKDGAVASESEQPFPVFALYNHANSLVQLDEALDQSATYGRFQVAKKLKKGEKVEFTFAWKGERDAATEELKLAPGKVAEAIAALKAKSEKAQLDLVPSLDGALTLGEAVAAAKALATIDSAAVRINGFGAGEFFYRSFLPDPAWKARGARLAQPYELTLKDGAATLVKIDEDWSEPGASDPKLVEKTVTFEAIAKLDFPDTAFIYAPAATSLKDLYALKARFPKAVKNFYLWIRE